MCVVHSMFHTSDIYMHDVLYTGVNVLNVTRIHNRWLRNRFEKHAALQGGVNDATYVPSWFPIFWSRAAV